MSLIRFKIPKRAGLSASLIASLAFIALAVKGFNFPLEKVWQFLGLCALLLLAILIVAVPAALIIRYFSRHSE